MKKLKKIILVLVVLLLLVVVIGAIVIGTSLDKIVKVGVETVAPKITQTTVTLDSVNISLLTGSAGVNGLVVGNPQGYDQTASAISIGQAAVGISPASLLSDKIVIRSVLVKSPEITFEGNPFGANNLTKIMDNVNSAAGTNAAPAQPAAPGAKKPAKKLEVDDFLLTGARVHVKLTGLINKQLDLPLPDIHLTDLGKGTDGITATDLTRQILSQVTTATVKAVADAAGNLGKSAAGAAGSGLNKLKQGIGGLFGK